MDLAADVPNVTVSGLKLHVTPGGSVPELHVRAISLRLGPPCGATVTTNVALCPAASEALPGVTSTEKSVTVTSTSVSLENARLLLLAPTLTDDVPNGHVIVVPGEEPQPPVHLRAEQPALIRIGKTELRGR